MPKQLISIYLHADRNYIENKVELLYLHKKAAEKAYKIGFEHKLTYVVHKNGFFKLIAVDEIPLNYKAPAIETNNKWELEY